MSKEKTTGLLLSTKERRQSRKRAKKKSAGVARVLAVEDSTTVRRTRRAQINKELNQLELRMTVAGGGHHLHVVNVINELAKVYKGIQNRRRMTKEEQAAFMSKIAALRSRGELHMRLLNKYLPDLRSVDLGTGEKDSPLSAALTAWAEALDRGVEE